jgi:integrase
MMDVQNLQEKYPFLLSYMKENGYSATYVRYLKTEINRILQGVNRYGWNTYEDVYFASVKKFKSKGAIGNKRSLLGIIKRFDEENLFPHCGNRYNFLKASNYSLLSDEYKQVIDIYFNTAKQQGKRESTIYVVSHSAENFLLELQRNGMDSFNGITEKGVLEIFFQEGKLRRNYSYKKGILTVLKTCIPFFPENTCARVLSYLPVLRDRKKNIQYLTGEEVSLIKAALTDCNSTVTLRNRAIGLIALYMGLRSGDIAELALTDIDWTKDMIHIKQQKTGIPLKLPLPTIVGNAIYDYLTQERPETQCEKVFVTETHLVTRLQSSSMYGISRKIMDAANIRKTPGNRRGLHIFRHHMAITLLENEVAQPVISRIMGHLSPASIEPYLSADFSHLKECALSIECFPLRKEVLS